MCSGKLGSSEFQFERLITPVKSDTFFGKYWERKHVVIPRADESYYSDLLTLDDFDKILSTYGLSYPTLEIIRDGATIDKSEYVEGSSTINLAKLYRLLFSGCSVRIINLNTRHLPLANLCRDLQVVFGFRFQTNAYLTPATFQGFNPHFDAHDLFILQISGKKEWSIFQSDIELPLRGQRFRPEVHLPGTKIDEFVLNSGDLVYIPRGVFHSAKSLDNISLHITLGTFVYTWTDLLVEAIIAKSERSVEFRKSLPVGILRDIEGGIESISDQYSDLIDKIQNRDSIGMALARMSEDLESNSQLCYRGQIGQLESLQKLDSQTIIRARSNVAFKVVCNAQSLCVESLDRKIELPKETFDTVASILSGNELSVSCLPGAYDIDSKITLVKRFVSEGLVEICS